MFKERRAAGLAMAVGLCTSLAFAGAPATAMAAGTTGGTNDAVSSAAVMPAKETPGSISFNGTEYTTLVAAFDAAKDGGTITLNGNIEVTGQTDADANGLKGNVVLDLNGHTVFGKNNNIAIRAKNAEGGSLTIKNGTIDAQEGTFCTVGASKATLILEGVMLKNCTEFGSSIKAFEGGVIDVRNCTSVSTQGGGVAAAGGTVNLYDSEFIQTDYYDWNSCLVSASNGTGVVNVYSGNYTSENYGAYIFTSGGTINFYGGEMKATGDKPVFKADLDLGSYPNAVGAITVKNGSFQGGFDIAPKVTASISGGTFDSEEASRYTVEGCALLVDEQGSATVMTAVDAEAKAGAAVVKDGKTVYYTSQQAAENANPGEGGDKPQITVFTASVDGKKYESVAAAIAEANGKTVTLLTDVTENITVPAGVSLTFDLAGNTLSGGTASGKAAITNNGTLTLMDSSSDGSGRVIREDNGAQGFYTILNQGEMTILSGSVYNKTGEMPRGSSLICNLGTADKPATLNIKGGDIKQDGFIAVKNDDYGILNITGGSISTTGNTSTHTASAVQNFHKATISGGKITGAVWTSVWSDELPVATTVITGEAEVTGDIIVKRDDRYPDGKTPEVKISGGTLNVGKWNIAEKDAVIQVSGGMFTGAAPADEFIVPGSGLVKDENGNLVVAVAKLFFTSDKVVNGVFTYDVLGGKAEPVTEADLLKLVGVNVEGHTVSVDASALPALNKAIGAAETSTEFSFKFTAAKDAAATRSGAVEPLTLKVKLVDSTVEPAPEPAEKATVTFDTGLGSSFTQRVELGSKLERPADPVHDGWKFAGWFTAKAVDGTLSGEWDFEKDVVEGDMTLYGGWVKATTPDAGDKPAVKPELPQTGDASLLPIAAAGAVGVVAVAAGATVAIKRRKAE